VRFRRCEDRPTQTFQVFFIPFRINAILSAVSFGGAGEAA
jgi:hypothetical protein